MSFRRWLFAASTTALLSSACVSLRSAELRSQGSAFLSEGKSVEALTHFRLARAEGDTSNELAELITRCERALVQEALDEAKQRGETGLFGHALHRLATAKRLVPDDRELSALAEALEAQQRSVLKKLGRATELLGPRAADYPLLAGWLKHQVLAATSAAAVGRYQPSNALTPLRIRIVHSGRADAMNLADSLSSAIAHCCADSLRIEEPAQLVVELDAVFHVEEVFKPTETRHSQYAVVKNAVWTDYTFTLMPVETTNTFSANVVVSFDRSPTADTSKLEKSSTGKEFLVAGVNPLDKNPSLPATTFPDTSEVLTREAAMAVLQRIWSVVGAQVAASPGNAESLEYTVLLSSLPRQLRPEGEARARTAAQLDSFLATGVLERLPRSEFGRPRLSAPAARKPSPTQPAKAPGAALSAQQIASLAKQSTVFIRTATACGSGFAVTPEFVATNRHVIESAEPEFRVVLPNGTELPARLAAVHRRLDIALVHVAGAKLQPIQIQSNPPAAGSDVFTAGFPKCGALGPDNAFGVTRGIVSRIQENDEVRHDAPINPGNSGGPLLNNAGDVVGVNTWKFVGPGIEGLAFAVAAGAVEEFVPPQANDAPAMGRISATLQTASSQLQNCQTTADSVTLRWWIRPNGSVARTELVEPKDASQSGGSCLLRTIANLRFPRSTGDADTLVELPIKLR